jgi:DNA polymerase I-like protein with 3'-5' exonuclease and polymerase domains
MNTPTKEEQDRRLGKEIEFNTLYGTKADDLRKLLGLTDQQVQAMESSWATRFPGVKV